MSIEMNLGGAIIKNKVFRSFLMILGHVIKNGLYATLTPTSRGRNEVQKINGHHIIRQNWMENPKN
jgi:hypothetical protein